MSKVRLMTAAVALSLIAIPASAQTTGTPNTGTQNTPGTGTMTQSGTMAGTMQPGTMNTDPMMGMSDADRYRMMWVYRNLDDASVKRLMAMGLDERTIRGAANIALRTGLPLDFVVRQIMIGGLPLNALAAQYGMSVTAVDADIPGMGMANPAMAMGSSRAGMMSGGMYNNNSNWNTGGATNNQSNWNSGRMGGSTGTMNNNTGTGTMNNNTGTGTMNNNTGTGTMNNNTGTGTMNNNTGTGTMNNNTGTGTTTNP